MNFFTKLSTMAVVAFCASATTANAQLVITEIGSNITSTEELQNGTHVAFYNAGRGLYVYNGTNRYEMGKAPTVKDVTNGTYCWTVEKLANGNFKFKDSSDKYIPVLGSGKTMTGKEEGDEFKVTATNGKWAIQGTDNNYFNGNGAGDGFCGWSATGGNSTYEIRLVTVEDLSTCPDYTITMNDASGETFGTQTVKGKPGFIVSLATPFRTLTSATYGGQTLTVTNGTVTIPEGDDKNITAVYEDNTPFKTTKIQDGKFVDATWYQLGIHNTGNRAYLKYNSEDQTVEPITSESTTFYDDTQLWCFTGSVSEGFKVYNKAAGTDKCMTYNTNNVIMTTASEKSVWSIDKTISTTAGFENGFCLKNSNTYINYNAKDKILTYYGTNDDGSTFTITSYDEYFNNKVAEIEKMVSAPENAIGTPKAGMEAAKTAFATYKATPNAETEKAVYDALNADPIAFSTDQYYRIMTTGRNNQQNYITSGTNLSGSVLNTSNASQIWKFTANGENYNMTSQGVFTTTPAQSVTVTTSTNSNEAQAFTINPKAGLYALYTIKAAIDKDAYELHLGSDFNIVGWNNSDASNWYLIPATNIDVNITAAGYATVNYPFAVQVTDGVIAYTGTADAAKEVFTLNKIEDGIIPANTPVVLEGAEGTHTLTILADNTTPALESGLEGTLLSKEITETNAYILGNKDSHVGFYQMDGTDRTLGANKAYLVLSPEASPVRSLIFSDGTTTGIENTVAEDAEAEEYYDLQGRRVMNPTKGIYVTKSGKKVLFNK